MTKEVVLFVTILLIFLPPQRHVEGGALVGGRTQFFYKVDHFVFQKPGPQVEEGTSEEIELQNQNEISNSIPNLTSTSSSIPNDLDVYLENNEVLPQPLDNSVTNNRSYVPLVYWHGMGDCGWNVKRALSFIEEELPGVYVKSIQIGDTVPEDIENSYFLNVNTQVDLVCEMIAKDPQLAGGYNAIGLSQGGQFLRAVAQRCPEPRMINLISLGGQHQGVFGLPKCSAPKKEWCEIIDKLVTHVAYAGWVQKFLVQAEYWHDPFKNAEYIAKSVFLADINNERTINERYRTNLQKLDNLVLVQFEDETIVQPKESEWFGYFVSGSDKEMVALENTTLYTEDRLGLKAMKEGGKLHLLSSPGDHLQFTREWFDTNILKPFLLN